jgi:hypothetical protein
MSLHKSAEFLQHVIHVCFGASLITEDDFAALELALNLLRTQQCCKRRHMAHAQAFTICCIVPALPALEIATANLSYSWYNQPCCGAMNFLLQESWILRQTVRKIKTCKYCREIKSFDQCRARSGDLIGVNDT